MQYNFSSILLKILFIQIVFFQGNIIHAMTHDYNFDTPSEYTISDLDSTYIHGGAAKLKGSLTHRGHIENGPAAIDWGTNVIIEGDYAYVTGYGAHAVTSIDISDPANMQAVGYIGANNINRLYGAYDLVKSGDFIYVASLIDDDMEVVDASDPTNLIHYGSFIDTGATLMNGIRSIDVVGDFAYLAAYHDDALQILDVSDPSNPIARGNITDTRLNGVVDVKVSGNYAYMTSYLNDSVQVINISNPDSPIFAGQIVDNDITELNGPWGITIRGNYAYVAGYIDDGLEIVNISDPTNPTHVGEIQNTDPGVFLNGAREITIEGDYAYVSASIDDALQIIDISDPTNPTHVGALDTNNGELNHAFGIGIDGSDVFMTSYTNGALVSIDTSNITAPVFQDVISGPVRLGNAVGMIVDGDYSYIASYGSSGVEILDISDSSSPKHVSSVMDDIGNTELWGAWDVAKQGDYLYVSATADDGIEVIDVSDPYNPTPVASISRINGIIELDNPRGSYIDGNYLYVASYISDALQIIDISNPLIPVARGFIKDEILLNGASHVVVQGSYAYVTGYLRDNISVVDVSDPDTPIYIGELRDATGLEINGSWDLKIDGDFLYVSTYIDDAVVIIDVSDPLNPVYMGDLDDDATIRLNGPRGISYDEGYAYLATYDDSIVTVDVSDPANPLFINEIRDVNLYDRSHGIDKQNNDIFFTQYVGSSFSVVRESYTDTVPFVTPDIPVLSDDIQSITLTEGEFNDGKITFQLSKDNGNTWYYFNGNTWQITTTGYTESNDPADINSNISSFNALVGTSQIKWKAFMRSKGSEKVEIDQISIKPLDLTPPVITDRFPAEDNLIPRHDFDITFEYNDGVGGVGVDTDTADLEIHKWTGGTWGSDIAGTYIDLSTPTIGTGSALYEQTTSMPYGKYRMRFTIEDLNGNLASDETILYIDEPELIVGSGSIDLGVINHLTNTFSETIEIEVLTIGAAFDLTFSNTTLLNYLTEGISTWNGSTGFGFRATPFIGPIQPLNTNEFIASEAKFINTSGSKNRYVYEIQLGAIIEELQAGGDYTGNLKFDIDLKY